MIINHNIAAMNTYNKLSSNNASASKALEKLSSGLRINRAGDDAAGLAISEKLRGQIRGLDQATRNAQDAVSLLNTAEGNLSETQSILQRMKELATQAANDTNVGVDRNEIQKEINQLTSEINRIGNTTEFNTQKLLCGDGKVNLVSTGLVSPGTVTANGAVTTIEAKQEIDKLSIKDGYTAGNTMNVTLNGKTLTVNLVHDTSLKDAAQVDTASATANSITVKYNATTAALDISTALGSAFTTLINNDADLAGNFTISKTAANTLTIEATKGGTAAGVKGSIAATTITDTSATAWAAALDPDDLLASVGTTTDTKSSVAIGLNVVDSLAETQALLGKGMTINGTQIEFYDANAGAYTGSAIGVNISELVKAGANPVAGDLTDAIVAQVNGKIDGVTLSNNANELIVTSTAVGKEGDGIVVRDGGVQENYKATFQVGANMGQSMTIEIGDMRSKALLVAGTTAGGDASVEGAVFTATRAVTNGTDNTNVEYALDVSDHKKATAAIKVISNAIETVSAERSKIGAYTNRLEHTIRNLGTSSENMTAAESRIRDVDMAKEMMNFQKNNILSQAAQAMLAQANQQPQGVLQLLR